MYFLCTGEYPFAANDNVEVKHINFIHKLMEYSDSKSFSDMADFISKLMVIDPSDRLSTKEALQHRWLKVEAYEEWLNVSGGIPASFVWVVLISDLIIVELLNSLFVNF